MNPLEHQNLTQVGAASAVRLSIVASLAICTFMLLVIGVEQVTFEDIFETTLHIPVLPAMTSVFYFAGGAHHAMMGNPDREIETIKRLPTSLRSVSVRRCAEFTPPPMNSLNLAACSELGTTTF
ncbi:hypothetical protein [Comamonas testosteroni]|uniref:hypothetical protein n=1 Tax=Comamonas testosteroni TaxID=285 RepID=UPI00391CC69C